MSIAALIGTCLVVAMALVALAVTYGNDQLFLLARELRLVTRSAFRSPR